MYYEVWYQTSHRDEAARFGRQEGIWVLWKKNEAWKYDLNHIYEGIKAIKYEKTN